MGAGDQYTGAANKVLTTKSNDLTLILGTYMEKGKNWFLQAVRWLSGPTHTQMHYKQINVCYKHLPKWTQGSLCKHKAAFFFIVCLYVWLSLLFWPFYCFKLFYYCFKCMVFCLYGCCATHVCLEPSEAREECQIPLALELQIVVNHHLCAGN